MGLKQSKKKDDKKFEHPGTGLLVSRYSSGRIKIGLLGDQKVGKTSICNSFVGIELQPEYLSTIGTEKFEKKQVLENQREIKINVWDTSGQERFRSVALKTLRNFGGIILVFDVTNRKSFYNLEEWLSLIKEECNNPFIILFGNKVDENKEKFDIDKEEIERFVKKHNLDFFAVSAKNGIGINEGISYLVKKLMGI